MKRISLLLLLTALLSCSSVSYSQPSNPEPHLQTALCYVGTREIGNNAGPEVEKFLNTVGLTKGNPYCAAFVSFTLTGQTPPVAFPWVRTGLATKFITSKSMTAAQVLLGSKQPEPGDIVVWRKGNTIFGHAGIVLEWDGACGKTIEANTSSGVYGSQSNGDGVWIRERCIELGNYFRIVSFTPVTY